MDAHKPDDRLTRLVTLGILILLGLGLWQIYGVWAVDGAVDGALDGVLAHDR